MKLARRNKETGFFSAVKRDAKPALIGLIVLLLMFALDNVEQYIMYGHLPWGTL